jgi:hypothetical protein
LRARVARTGFAGDSLVDVQDKRQYTFKTYNHGVMARRSDSQTEIRTLTRMVPNPSLRHYRLYTPSHLELPYAETSW